MFRLPSRFGPVNGAARHPLAISGHGASGCKIARWATTHSVRYDPDAAIIQEGQGILARRADITGFGSSDFGPWPGLYYGATSLGSCCRVGGTPMEAGPNRATIWS